MVDRTIEETLCVCGRRIDRDVPDLPNDRRVRETCGNFDCQRHALGFGALELRRESGGWRHYLRNEPIHCGTGLLLAAQVEGKEPLSEGSDDPRWDSGHRILCARVRYESPLATSPYPPALLYTEVCGHEAVITANAGMRLRFLPRSRP